MADSSNKAEWLEHWWIVFSLLLVAVFFALVAYSVMSHGAHIARSEPLKPPAEIMSQPRFASPGLVEKEPGHYQLNMVAQAFSFLPAAVEIPAGSTVDFFIASRDVIHGFQILGTNINVEIIPGQVAHLSHQFDRPGDYRLVCNQYCGRNHQDMQGLIRVVSTGGDEFAVAEEVPAETPDGEAVYKRNCQGCHQANGQGLPNVFPPLAWSVPGYLDSDQGRAYLVQVLLYGLSGEIVVDDKHFNSVMPPQRQLSEEEIAQVLNYISRAWGNDAMLPPRLEPFSADEITEQAGLSLTGSQVRENRPVP